VIEISVALVHLDTSVMIDSQSQRSEFTVTAEVFLFRTWMRSIDRKVKINEAGKISPMCWSVFVCLSVSPESALWQNGLLYPDAVWGGDWGRSMDAYIRSGPRGWRCALPKWLRENLL